MPAPPYSSGKREPAEVRGCHEVPVFSGKSMLLIDFSGKRGKFVRYFSDRFLDEALLFAGEIIRSVGLGSGSQHFLPDENL